MDYLFEKWYKMFSCFRYQLYQKENFEDIIGMGMPALIMPDTKNDISGIYIDCVDKAVMTESIKKALGE